QAKGKGRQTALRPGLPIRGHAHSRASHYGHRVRVGLAAGEYTMQANDAVGGLFSAEERITHSVPAKLYALDAMTGKELYSSGNQVTSFLHQAGPSVADDKVMFGTFDGTIYCFGLK